MMSRYSHRQGYWLNNTNMMKSHNERYEKGEETYPMGDSIFTDMVGVSHLNTVQININYSRCAHLLQL